MHRVITQVRGIGLLVALAAITVTACGGASGPAALALGTEAVVEHQPYTPAGAPSSKIGITPLRLRQGTLAEMEAAGFELEPEDQSKTPMYVDVMYANKGESTVDRKLDVSLHDQDDNLINDVVVLDLFGAGEFDACPAHTVGPLAPGESFESCSLFLVPSGRTPTRLSFLPHLEGKATDFVYWNVK